jgi:nucleoside-diphosphate-sugar epimerase
LRRLPLVPLPGGGRALVQPIHQGDVTASLLAAIGRRWEGPHSLVIAGPEPIAYADFVRAVAQAAGLAPPRIVTVPAWSLMLLAPLTRLLPGPTVRGAEIRRLLEDKAFSIAPMRRELSVIPRALEAGLATIFSPAAPPPRPDPPGD